MRNLRFPPTNLLAVLHDCTMAALSFVLALSLRLQDRLFVHTQGYIVEGTGVFTLLLLASMLYFRTYRRVWRYTSLSDLLLLARAGTVALVLFYFGMFLVTRLEMLPRSVPFIHWMTLMLCLSVGRVAIRILRDKAAIDRLFGRGHTRTPVLLIGANAQTEMFIRESERSVIFPYRVVGIIDEDARQHGREIHGVRIYGAQSELAYILQKLARKSRAPQRLLLTESALHHGNYEAILAAAEAANLPLARLPSLSELKAGKAVHEIRAVAVEDILGRTQAVLSRETMRDFITAKRVLITGAGGSIGAELVRQIVSFDPAELLLYELSEFALYTIDEEIARIAPQVPRIAVIGDVRDADQLARVFAQFRPEVVFHAAAIKHVPLSESNPEQAILTNILGGKNVADACLAANVTAMVQISTDKAVNPTSVMGASKRVAEIYAQALAQQSATTKFITVRFGNVLNSTGSVVPLFQQQIARGGPVTVTHPDMVRYFMTISEAVQLVLKAAALGVEESSPTQAPIFVLDMGDPVRIVDLACQMIRLAGFRPYKDIAITFTGLRPGEKLFEELFHDAENFLSTRYASIRLAKAREMDRAPVLRQIDALIAAAHGGDTVPLRPLIQTLVPEYQWQASAT